MRNMRSPLPVFIFVFIGVLAIVGVVILQASASTAASQVNNSTTENLAVALYGLDFYLMLGISAIIFIVAMIFALKSLT